ncbi:antirestriction protein [Haloarcula marina]|uniref:antirestriction protein n=1 Tax=Haloarcula marina TaxID=2961574 RepID=UPI0020B6FBCB|nr:antirestriction protein [Halomicroarcula marina]
MDRARRLLVLHFGVGLSGLAFFVSLRPELPGAIDALLIASVGLAIAALQHRFEHEALPDRVYAVRDYADDHPLLLVAGIMLTAAVAALPIVVERSLVRWYFDAIFGLYVGSLGYRVLYGLVRPVPEAALERV